MYIEFELPAVFNGTSAAQANIAINNHLIKWSQKYQIPYKTKIVKYTKRVTFDSDESYSLFAMTWDPENNIHPLVKWRIVSDLNNKI